MKAVIVTVHGQESNGKNIKALSDSLAIDSLGDDCKFINIRYPRLLTVVNALPWVRKMTAKYVASRLETINWKYPGVPVFVIAHSNGTVAVSNAMVARKKARARALFKTGSMMKYPDFKVSTIFLLGCPMKRKFDWLRFPYTRAINFISKNDKVVFLARLYGMGAAGRYGFKPRQFNVLQIHRKYGHSGFMKIYGDIKEMVEYEIELLPYRDL